MNYKNNVKEKIKKGKVSLGGWCMTASSISAELMALAGFDWVCLDLEHSAVNMEKMLNVFNAIENSNSEPFVRISHNSETECKKVLDAGAKGIIAPMIKSSIDLEKIVSYVKYPPVGKRSYALPRATKYGDSAKEYYKKANDMLFLAIMIEHIDAIKELDKIFQNKHIDAVLVGPYDLSGSMGIPGEFDNSDFKKVISEINQKANKYNINMGIHEVHPNYKNIKTHINNGFKFIACGIDTLFIKDSARKIILESKKNNNFYVQDL